MTNKPNPNKARYFDRSQGMTFNAKCPDCKAPTFSSERVHTIYSGKAYTERTSDKIVGVIGDPMERGIFCQSCAETRGLIGKKKVIKEKGTNLEKLRKLANQATPGPWVYEENGIAYINTTDKIYGPEENLPARVAEYMNRPDGEFIAAVDPTTLLKLLDVVTVARNIGKNPQLEQALEALEEKLNIKRPLND